MFLGIERINELTKFTNEHIITLYIHGDVMASTIVVKHYKRVVDGCFGHLKKAEININADNRELAYAA